MELLVRMRAPLITPLLTKNMDIKEFEDLEKKIKKINSMIVGDTIMHPYDSRRTADLKARVKDIYEHFKR